MNDLSIPVLQLIQNFGGTKAQCSLRRTSKKIRVLKLTVFNVNTLYTGDEWILKYARDLVYLKVPKNTAEISDDSVQHLKKLQTLIVNGDSHVSDDSVKLLTNLQTLIIRGSERVTGDSVKLLTNLRMLDVTNNICVEDQHIMGLKNLQVLYAAGNSVISDRGIKELKQLRVLNVRQNNNITDDGIKALTMLHTLYIGIGNSKIIKTSIKNIIYNTVPILCNIIES